MNIAIAIITVATIAALLVWKLKATEWRARRVLRERAYLSGVRVYSDTGTGYPPPVDAIRAGFEAAAELAACHGYRWGFDATNYVVVILRRAGIYKGVPVLYRGFTRVGGFALDVEQIGGRCIIVIPDHTGIADAPAKIVEIVKHEAWHHILWANDRDEYNRTKVHRGDVFPKPCQ
jgi:hypothetical protein